MDYDDPLDTRAAHGLGWTSIAIGLAEVAGAEQLERLMGLPHDSGNHAVMRVLGVRELMHGWALLSQKRASKRMTAGVWARVLGDVLDTAALVAAGRKTRKPQRFAAVAASVMAIGALDLVCAMKMQHDYPA